MINTLMLELPGYLATVAPAPAEGSSGSQIIISIVIGAVITSLLWIPLAPRLKRSHDKMEKIVEGADTQTQAAANFYRPPNWVRKSSFGVWLQFFLVLLPVTAIVYYVLSRL